MEIDLTNLRFNVQLLPSSEMEAEMIRLLDAAGGIGPAFPVGPTVMTLDEAHEFFKGMKAVADTQKQSGET